MNMKEKDCLYGWLRLCLLNFPVTQMEVILRLRHLALVLLLLMSMGVNGVWGQTDITSLSDIADPTGYYRLTSDVSGAGHTSIASFSGTLEAAIDPTTKMPFRITGSVNSYERLDFVKSLKNLTGFTIGGAFFENKFGETFAENVTTVCEYLLK